MSHASNTERNTRDAELIRRIKIGDASALTELARSYAQKLGDVAMIITHSPDLAQDAVQDTFIWLWDNRARLDINGTALAYLVRAVRNRAQNIVRHESAHYRLEERVHKLHENKEPHSEQDIEASLIHAEDEAVIQSALQEMSPRTREIFLMRLDAGLSYAEIAEALGVTLATVKGQLHRATKELAQRFMGQ